MINLSETDDPYLIFESLNHKGEPLTQADLVRNYVLMRFQHSTLSGGEQEIIYNELWRPMEVALGDSMPEFLRHYSMRKGRNVKKGDIYTALKKEFEQLGVADVRAQLSAIRLAALAYEKFLKPAKELNEEISRRLWGIQELDFKVFYPLLIRLYGSWEQGIIRC